jgi:hypothetical protein
VILRGKQGLMQGWQAGADDIHHRPVNFFNHAKGIGFMKNGWDRHIQG